jgi:hypothetical protein
MVQMIGVKKTLFEYSFIQWYSSGRLGFIPLKEADFLKEYCCLLESIAILLKHLHLRKSQLHQLFKECECADFSSGDLKAVSEAADSTAVQLILNQTDKLTFVNDDPFQKVAASPLFKQAAAAWPQLIDTLDFPVPACDRAFYWVEVGTENSSTLIEAAFPPTQVVTEVEAIPDRVGQVFVSEGDETMAVLDIGGTCGVWPIALVQPYCSRFSEADQKRIQEFYEKKIKHFSTFLAAQTALVNTYVERFAYTFDSAAYLVRSNELPLSCLPSANLP